MKALDSLIGILSSPIAKRKGVTISAEDCGIWVEELGKDLKEYYNNLKP